MYYVILSCFRPAGTQHSSLSPSGFRVLQGSFSRQSQDKNQGKKKQNKTKTKQKQRQTTNKINTK
jgi:hypothetical protein